MGDLSSCDNCQCVVHCQSLTGETLRNSLTVSVKRGNLFLGRLQHVKIVVEDVDEPPAFVNSPAPFLAVVPLERPIGFHVYKVFLLEE